MWRRFTGLLGARVDGASLAMFRICFGAVMLGEAYRLLKPLPGGTTRLANYYLGDVKWNFPYHGFEWVTACPEPWLSVTCYVLGLAALSLMWGLFSRLSAAIIFITWTYLLLLDECRYNNHYYLQALIAFLLIWSHAGNCFSFDRGLQVIFGRADRDVRSTVPFWTIFLLRSQLAIMYFYGGVAKISFDWLVDAQPMGIALEAAAHRFGDPASGGFAGVIHALLTAAPTAYVLSYAGVLFDLSIAIVLLVPRTRLLGVLLVIVFHALNHVLLFADIGLFPLMAVAVSLIFLDPDWPRQLMAWLKHRQIEKPDVGWLIAGALLIPVVGAALGWKLKSGFRALPAAAGQPKPLVVGFVCVWICIQMVLPVRHFLISGEVDWTDEGGRWSWRMKGTARNPLATHILIADPEIIRLGESGKPIVDRANWTGSPVIYRQVVSRRVDWRKLPEVVVVMQPLVGEFIFFNPLSGGRNTSVDEGRRRVNRIWEELYGRRPASIVEVKSLREMLDMAESAVGQMEGGRALAPVFRDSRKLARTLEDAHLPMVELDLTVRKLRNKIDSLVVNPRYGGVVRQYIARTYPLSVHGGIVQAPFLTIEDLELYKFSDDRIVTLNRDIWKNAWNGAEEVVVDLDSLTYFESKLIPPVFLTIDEFGRAGVGWDQSRDLAGYQNKLFAIFPFMVHQYAHEIARRWHQEHGRYPKVHVIDYVKLNHHRPQLLIDPDADLASEPIKLFQHNQWIRSSQRKSPVTMAVEP